MKKILIAAMTLLLFAGCKKTPDISADYLGGGSCLIHPFIILRITSYPHQIQILRAAEAQKPVIIASHGYSASTFEWNEFKTWSAGRTDYYISQVLLAGHGTTYADFKKSTWHDWQSSIADEYNKLVKAGYKNINFAASSTSCTLLLDMIHAVSLTTQLPQFTYSWLIRLLFLQISHFR